MRRYSASTTQRSLIPTVNVVTATGWAADEKPVAAEPTKVIAFARALDHPRWFFKHATGGIILILGINRVRRIDDHRRIPFFDRPISLGLPADRSQAP